MTETSGGDVDVRAIAMRTLFLDMVAGQAITVLEARGIEVVLLKGRVTANWLYTDRVRRYGDVDLLVNPARRGDAVEALATIGYRHLLAGADAIEFGPNEVELRGPNQVCIDLHHTLLGVAGRPEQAWSVLTARTERMRIGGREVRVLSPAARTMHLALHAAQNGPSDRKAVDDLERGLDQLPLTLWQEAARIAESIEASEAFASGLGVVYRGRELRELLDLRPVRDIGLILRSWSAPPESLQIQKLVEIHSTGSRVRFVARKLWPTSAYMHGRDPAAASGLPLLRARLRRMTGLPAKFGVAVRTWRQARRFERQLDTAPTVSMNGRKSS